MGASFASSLTNIKKRLATLVYRASHDLAPSTGKSASKAAWSVAFERNGTYPEMPAANSSYSGRRLMFIMPLVARFATVARGALYAVLLKILRPTFAPERVVVTLLSLMYSALLLSCGP